MRHKLYGHIIIEELQASPYIRVNLLELLFTIDSIYCVHNHPPLAIVVLQEGEKKESSDRIHQSNSFKVLD